MRFEVALKKDKMKVVCDTINMAIVLLKARPITYSVYFIYVQQQNEIRILVQNQNAPIVIVLTQQLFSDVVSASSSNDKGKQNSIGFQFKNGVSFLESLISFIKDECGGGNTLLTEEEKTLFLKITKDNNFRFLQLKLKSKVRREQIEKPIRKEEELFTYQWLDGVTNPKKYFEINPTSLVQIFRFVSKYKSAYPISMMPEKRLSFTVSINEMKVNLKMECLSSHLELCCKIIQCSEQNNRGVYEYEIKAEDAQMLILAIKNESQFVIDQDNTLSITYNSQSYICQICLKNWIVLQRFISGEEQEQRYGGLKRQL